MLKRNLDTKGRVLRFTIAILLLIFAIWQESWIALGLAMFVFFEAIMSWCIVYQFLGINHCDIRKK